MQEKSTAQHSGVWWQTLEVLAHVALVGLVLWAPAGNVFGKSVRASLFVGTVGLMLIAQGWLWWKDSQARAQVTITPVHAALLFFAIALGISASVSADPRLAWFGTLHWGIGTVQLYGCIVWALLIGTLVRRRKFLRQLLLNLFCCAVVVAVTTYRGENGGLIGNSSFAGAYLLFGAGAGAALLWLYTKGWQKLLTASGLALIVLGPLFVSVDLWCGAVRGPAQLAGVAQGAAMGLALAAFAAVLVALARSRKQVLRWAGALGVVAVTLGLWWGGVQFVRPDSALHRYVVEQKSANRFLFWNIAAAGLADRPLMGYGFGNFAAALQAHFDPVIFAPGYEPEVSMEHSHNVFWEYAVTTGAVGLVAYVALFAAALLSLFFAAKRQERDVRIAAIVFSGVLAGYLLQNMFVFDTIVSYGMYFTVIGIALGTVKRPILRLDLYRLRPLAFLSGAIGVGMAVVLGIAPWRESVAWTRAITEPHASENTPQSVSRVGALSDTLYLASGFYAKSEPQLNSPQARGFLKEKFSMFAGYLQADIVREPNDYRAYLMKGILENALISFNQRVDLTLLAAARSDLDRAIALESRTPEVYFNRAQTALYEKNSSAAAGYIRAGIALEPRNESGYTLAAALLKIAPNADFSRYVTEMRKIYGL
jgi:hypothetical protein